MSVVKSRSDDEKLFEGVLRFDAKLIGLVLGVLLGLFIFILTNILVLKGGHVEPDGEYVVGPHLGLLSQFFIGYSVSFVGSFIGFIYGFAAGTLCGSLIGWIYNLFVDFRN